MAAFLKKKSRQYIIAWKLPRLLQVRHMSIPRIRAKPDRALDEVTERDKLLRPFFRIMDIIGCGESRAIKVRHLEYKRWELGIKNKKLNVTAFVKRYPNIFTIYTSSDDRKPWCKPTPEFLALVDEERKVYRGMESQTVQTLRKLLMMSAAGRICKEKLQSVRRIFGFPEDFLERLVPEYPQYFKNTCSGTNAYIELVEWDEGLAVSEFEKAAKQDAIVKGLGEIEVKGKPFSFRISLSPGMALRKKNMEVLESWQKLPYISPYEDWTKVQKGNPLSEKRLVALLHEFLSLTVEKKARLKVIQPFREEYGLSQKIRHIFERFPGIFYTSLRGGVKTIMLREAYKGSNLLENHPLVTLKEKYVNMVEAGPRLLGRKDRGVLTDGELVDEVAHAESRENGSESSGDESMEDADDAENADNFEDKSSNADNFEDESSNSDDSHYTSEEDNRHTQARKQ